MCLNLSAMHLGVGTAIGRVLITQSSLAFTPWAGALLTAVAAGLALFASQPNRPLADNVEQGCAGTQALSSRPARLPRQA